MNIALWITSGLLAAVALTGGATKTFMPKQKLVTAHGAEWTENVAPGYIKTLGILELLAAPGLILPAAFDVAPVMVQVTAACWIVLMIGAATTHLRLGQNKLVLVNMVYLAVAAFIAIGR